MLELAVVHWLLSGMYWLRVARRNEGLHVLNAVAVHFVVLCLDHALNISVKRLMALHFLYIIL